MEEILKEMFKKYRLLNRLLSNRKEDKIKRWWKEYELKTW